jgi:hypothetical protein
MRRRKHAWDQSKVASRAWTRSERKVVWRGWLGRLTIAIEPMIVGLFFAVLPIALMLRRMDFAIFVAPIFAMAAIAFILYAIVLMVPCTKAILETYSPIYIVDGYIRYRKAFPPHSPEPTFFVAVLNEDRRILGEWPLREWPESIGERELWPVLVEFSPYGGIHKIDGHPTGVLPNTIPSFGVGISAGDRDPTQP